MSLNKAFTLAETLITISIIGIVSALTIPSIVSNYKHKTYSVKLKKFYSAMTQAFLLSEIENGSPEKWNKVAIPYNPDNTINIEKNSELSYQFISTYLLPYINYSKVDPNSELSNTAIAPKVYLNDGSHFYLLNGACVDFYYDVNGDKKPNTEGVDRYRFLHCTSESDRQIFFGTKRRYFDTYGIHNASTPENNYREFIRNKCAELGKYCSDLLRIDDWEYKKDYPYKL